MRPHLWQPPESLSQDEAVIVRRIHRAKLFVFLRQQRHTLFSPAFQEELATLLYADRPKGHPPVPPALLALATLLQASTGASDDEVIEATMMDRRWQLALAAGAGSWRWQLALAAGAGSWRWPAWTARSRRLAKRRLWPSASG